MALKTLHDLPPYGFFIYAPETNWTSPKYIGLDAAILEVQKHRLANPRFNWPTDTGSIKDFILKFTEARLRQMPGGEQWLVGPAESPPPNFPLPQRQRQSRLGELSAAAGGSVQIVKNTLAGIGLWLEFFGDGPVKPELAASRAATCARCPLNNREGSLLQRFNEASAKEITAIFGSLKHLKLTTPHDDMLGVCDACDCPNKSNVFTPIEIKLKHLRAEARAKLDPGCWVLSEEKARACPVDACAGF